MVSCALHVLVSGVMRVLHVLVIGVMRALHVLVGRALAFRILQALSDTEL